MADKSKITWTEATWNPIRGCSKVSSGCKYCYAEEMASRFCGPGAPYEGLITDGHWNGTVHLVQKHLDDPLRWKRPRRIFVNSTSDLFHESLAFEDIARIFGVMAARPEHTFQVLTKRAARMLEFFQWLKAKGDEPNPFDKTRTTERMAVLMAKFDMVNREERFGPWPLPNVQIGVSVENQAAAEERITLLRQVPAAVRWVSFEPLLGPVDLDREYLALACGGSYPFPMLEDRHRTKLVDLLDWVVVGGESGSHARPMHPDWARGLRDQCAEAHVPFLFKQWGEWIGAEYDGAKGKVICQTADPEERVGRIFWTNPGCPRTHVWGPRDHYWDHASARVGKKSSGRLLDGKLHDEYPIPALSQTTA